MNPGKWCNFQYRNHIKFHVLRMQLGAWVMCSAVAFINTTSSLPLVPLRRGEGRKCRPMKRRPEDALWLSERIRSPLPAWMELAMYGLQTSPVDMRVVLRRADVCVPQKFLDGAQVGATGEQVRREAMT